MKKTTHPLMQLLVMLLISLIMLIATTIITALCFDINETLNMKWLQVVTQLLTFFLPVVITTWLYYRGEQRSYYRLNFKGKKWLQGLVGVIIMLLLMPLIDWTTVWNDSWHWSENWAPIEEQLRQLGERSEAILSSFLEDGSTQGLISNLFVIALVPAICEEVFFRAGIQNLLERWSRNRHLAIWITAFIFSLLHGEIFAFLPRFMMGAVLGYLYVYSGSILPNMLAHFVNNAIVVLTYYLSTKGIFASDPDAPLSVALIPTICCTLASVALFYITFCKKLKTNQ